MCMCVHGEGMKAEGIRVSRYNLSRHGINEESEEPVEGNQGHVNGM